MSEDEIRKNLGSDKMLIGKNTVLKAVRQGKVKKVFLAKNTADELKNDLSKSGCEVESLELRNDELGTLCKKPFAVSVIGVL